MSFTYGEVGNLQQTRRQGRKQLPLSVKPWHRIKIFGVFPHLSQYCNKALELGATKTGHFTDKQNEVAAIMKALGHPARVAIIDYLLTVDTCICGDIVAELPLAQPTVSQHLKELKSAGLIKGNVEGNTICYCVDKATFLKFQSYLTGVFQRLQEKNDNCC